MICNTCYIPVYYVDDACSDDDKRGCNNMNQEKTICPHYVEDNDCDCPYGVEMHPPMDICPPAEQVKENLFEAWLDMKREREQSDEQLEELNAELEREKCKGWNR